jgi:uncharacterized YccA/Bax inhibitor family protein
MAVENPALNSDTFARGIAQATAAESSQMTVAATYTITAGLLVLLSLAGAFGWSQVQIEVIGGVDVALTPRWIWLAFPLTFVLAMVGAFAFRAAPIIAPLYALGEGALLGVVSRYFELDYAGIVAQAVLATLGIFLAMLALYATRLVKVTSKMVLGVAAAMGGLAIMWTTAWLLSLFGVNLAFLYAPTPLGIALSIGIVILGALNLIIDFDFIERSAASHAPGYMAWYAGFGLMLAIIWIYLSVLRVLALLRGSQ